MLYCSWKSFAYPNSLRFPQGTPDPVVLRFVLVVVVVEEGLFSVGGVLVFLLLHPPPLLLVWLLLLLLLLLLVPVTLMPEKHTPISLSLTRRKLIQKGVGGGRQLNMDLEFGVRNIHSFILINKRKREEGRKESVELVKPRERVNPPNEISSPLSLLSFPF